MQLWKMVVLALAWFMVVPLAHAQTAPADGLSVTVQAGYQVGPGDQLKIEVYNEADLTGSFKVSEEGSLNLPLVGKVDVQGKTASEIADHLTEVLAADFLVDPQVQVNVEQYASKPVQVLGAVRKPGKFYLSGTTSVLDILSQAGGVVAEKSSAEVHIKRARTGEIEPLVVSLDKLMATGEGNVELQAGDVVYVPEGVFVYVTGEVKTSGPVLWREGMTVSQAIAGAGGATDTANLRKIYIVRGGQQIKVNLRRILKARDPDIPMQPGDQLYVDESVM